MPRRAISAAALVAVLIMSLAVIDAHLNGGVSPLDVATVARTPALPEHAPAPAPRVSNLERALRVAQVVAEAFPTTTTSTTTTTTAPPAPIAVSQQPTAAAPPTDIAAVMACIRDHESGDYTNHSNGPEGASGAYQYVGSTWRHWSVAAGRPGYSAAWLAPPDVQDAVTAYTLTHGGAGNWSMRWGNDPCTAGLPGGG